MRIWNNGEVLLRHHRRRTPDGVEPTNSGTHSLWAILLSTFSPKSDF